MLQQLTNEINEITTDLYSPRLIKTADLDLKFKYDSNHLHHQIHAHQPDTRALTAAAC